MLTLERQEIIVQLVKEKQVVKLIELIEATGASESTIRRDLTELEDAKKLKRIHGGATLLQKKSSEPTVAEKTLKNSQEKLRIAEYAASFVEKGDCIFLDAGTTTIEMIPFLKDKHVVVVTNGLSNIVKLVEAGIETHVIGGQVKPGTRAFVGRSAIETLESFRFDLAFLGANGITLEDGYTTPDPQEAFVKSYAKRRSRNCYVLADHSKYGDLSFSKFAEIHEVTLITSSYLDEQIQRKLKELTDIKVVSI
ncbi:DeoR/GlpR family DNA-binding transcription regulator [Alkalicoccobacillus porphyridii]|uniref:DeoR/GlpR transcriptional regulator n=1 Tax=Alkalicoccobacillus porphyridii TaxID=2597270 RepID=A0A553ZV84_9BACI|nr:DeoR/GlpR family DNA-binding transcription regulator [Alkalicoccobacillus porphyridii]TSB45245.1 DeoR/GlpR transcriptional regulator [Alkalicoccobacillus porphyridii]